MKIELGILCSGNLGFELLKKINQVYNIVFVFTDFGSKNIIKYCDLKKIPIFKGNPRKGKSEDFSKLFKCDILVSINYLFIIEKNVIDMSRDLSFNIHGSLLPKYRGRTPHVWAIINNEINTGITAHLIDENCDTGDILRQITVSIGYNDTGNSILNKYYQLYYSLIEGVLEDYMQNKLYPVKQNNEVATYFGKRSPEDGKISWDWQKERIRNWVRAQSYPYPGAFSFYEGKKIKIDWIEYSDTGYDQNMKNGEIINDIPLEVKTSNGVIRIIKLREKGIKFKKGKFLE